MKFYIDPGRGGRDPGAVNGAHPEKTDALCMGLALRDEMQRRGYTVAMTRIGDTCPSFSERANFANGSGADVYISLHRNSATAAAATCIEVLYRSQSDKTAANNTASMKLAVELDKRGVAAMSYRDRDAMVQHKYKCYFICQVILPFCCSATTAF